MDTTFYHDELGVTPEQPEAVKRLKKSMTLDFNSGGSKPHKFTNLLQSPDLNLLKLASPELERMIIAANGMVTTTPTPTQFLCPKYVTDEQEAYARGFVDALNELHKNESPQGADGAPHPLIPTSNVSQFSVSPNTTGTQTLSTTTTLPGSILHKTTSASPPMGSLSERLPRLKEEPQTVPCLGSTPPLSPIDMESQERIKLERKRARNRVAARKCRTRKLERISRLEDKVKDLKDQNSDLAQTASTLREQVCKLKQQIMDHVNSGCQVMMANNIQF
ncbi:transcription factor Jun-like [Liolophura sinensis]|uniref:transcription factor Jun-like n=1 Tax=Liolophura sinensis TaxID=3198878 RepID=UPI0031590AE3